MKIFYKLALVSILLLTVISKTNAQYGALNAGQKTLSKAEDIVGKTSDYVNKIDETFEKIKNNNLYKALVDGKEFTFPIGILPGDGDKNYALAIQKVFITPEGMFAEIYMKIPVGSNKSLYFLADKVPFSRSGGLSGDLRLYLLKTDSITVGKGYNIVFNGLESTPSDPEKSCFITFNCKGFKDATLTGAVNFNKSSIVKDGDSKQQVSIKYYIQADKLSNFIIELKDIPTFEFTNLPGFKCTVPSITLDKSDIKNAPDFALPQWYKDSIQVVVHDPNAIVDGVNWEGMYIPKIDIDIPRSFKEDKPDQIVSIHASDFIIDQNGVTILSHAKNLLSGKLKSWEYSIDSIEVNLIASSLSKALIMGKITLPISKKESQISYTLIVTKKVGATDLSYYGRADIERDGGILDANAFGMAKIHLQSASLIFEYTNKQFYPSAILTGSITLGPKKKGDDNGKSVATFGLDFALLKLSTKAPYLDVADAKDGGYIKMSTQGSMMSSFPVSISELGIKKDNGGQRFGIYMTLDIKLQKSGGDDSKGSNGFGGSASFTIWTARDAATQKWKYDGFELDKIVVDVKNSSFSIHGEISRFQDDLVYGTGFCGYLDVKIIDKLEIKVAAIFGRQGQMVIDIDHPPTDASMDDGTTEYRYWFVDAAVTFPVIPVGPMIGINGFTGGLYHNMKMERTPDPDGKQTTVDCKTASGMRYVPDNSIFLGLIAGIGLQSVPTDAIFNGNITFALEFNNNGGLNMVAFWGGVTLITPPIKVPDVAKLKGKMDMNAKPTKDKESIKSSPPAEEEPQKGSIRVTWFTQYDVPKKTFIGDFDVYINIVDIVTGVGANNKAGHIAVMFSPDAKYVYMGLPLDPIGIDVLNLFKCTSYFCAGNKLPTPPIAPLPSEIHPSSPIDYGAMDTGAGLSFGARVEIGGKFGAGADVAGCDLWVGAELWLKAGFDVMITKTNVPVYCDGFGERGIHNWYATGQAFIAGGMRVGLDYDCGILGSGTKNLLSATLTAYVFAQLPKPSYLKGEVSLEFKLLGIGGHAHIQIELGDQCEKKVADKNIVFISTILPDSASTNIKVTEQIIVNFAKPIEKFKFNLPDENSDNKTIEYYATVGSGDIKINGGGKSIPFSMEWNSSKTSVRISPLTVLPENTLINVEVNVILQGGGQSVPTEKRIITFTTILEPIKIDVNNVAYSYPLPGMKNYYKGEYNTGYVKLFSLPKKPMKLADGYAYNVIFEQGGKEVARVTDVTVNNATGVEQFVYTIPNDKLVNATNYTFKISKVNTRAQKKDAQDRDDKSFTDGYNIVGTDTVILEYDFTTSRFSSFSQKMAYYNQSLTEVSGSQVTNTLSPNSGDVAAKNTEAFASEETDGYMAGAIRTSLPLLKSLGADFTNGFPIRGSVPDSVKYSYYSDKLVVQYNVFSEIDAANHNNKQQDIVCTVNATDANCGGGTASGDMIFPKAKYFYKMGYFLPGRDVKTSEVLQSFTLPEEVKLSY